MKISKVKLLSVMFTGALAFVCAPAMADDKKAASADTAKAEEPVKKKKKGPAKKPEYFRWNDAAAIAEAWEQPVLVFIDLEDSKECGRVRSATVGHNLFKAFVKENCVFYRYKVPCVKARRGRGNRGSNNNKNAAPKPDFESVRDSERNIVNKVLGGKKSRFPGLALVKPNGQLVDLIAYDPDEPSLTAMVGELKEVFEKGKYDFTVPKPIQKLIDAEAKKRAALEKRKKK